jgi:hypothetical protein
MGADSAALELALFELGHPRQRQFNADPPLRLASFGWWAGGCFWRFAQNDGWEV